MSALKQALGQDAPVHQFEHDGKTYQVRLMDLTVEMEFEDEMLARARHLLWKEKQLAGMGDDEYERRCQRLNDNYLAGEYAFESEHGQRYVKSPKGATFLASLLFQTDIASIRGLLAERGPDVAALIQLVLHEALPFVKKMQAAEAESEAENGEALEESKRNALVTPPSA